MKDQIKAYDALSMVLDMADERFCPLWKPDDRCKDILKQYCGIIDSSMRDFRGKSITVEVDEITMDIHITVEYDDEIILDENNPLLYQLIERTKEVSFSPTEDNTMLMELTYPGIWDKV